MGIADGGSALLHAAADTFASVADTEVKVVDHLATTVLSPIFTLLSNIAVWTLLAIALLCCLLFLWKKRRLPSLPRLPRPRRYRDNRADNKDKHAEEPADADKEREQHSTTTQLLSPTRFQSIIEELNLA